MGDRLKYHIYWLGENSPKLLNCLISCLSDKPIYALLDFHIQSKPKWILNNRERVFFWCGLNLFDDGLTYILKVLRFEWRRTKGVESEFPGACSSLPVHSLAARRRATSASLIIFLFLPNMRPGTRRCARITYRAPAAHLSNHRTGCQVHYFPFSAYT
jgi:hypothetical protein